MTQTHPLLKAILTVTQCYSERNAVDLFYVVTISVSIVIFGDKSSKISGFNIGCLIAVLLIVIFWIFTQKHIVTNFLIQSILVIAYFPVIQRMLKTRESSESFIIWIGMLVAPVMSLMSSKGMLATVYSVRAIFCVGFLLLFMLWIEFYRRKTRQIKPESIQKIK